MKQYETQSLVLDVCAQVRGLRAREAPVGRGMLGGWLGMLRGRRGASGAGGARDARGAAWGKWGRRGAGCSGPAGLGLACACSHRRAGSLRAAAPHRGENACPGGRDGGELCLVLTPGGACPLGGSWPVKPSLFSTWFVRDHACAPPQPCPQRGPGQSSEPCGHVNGFCLLITSVPGTMCFLLPKPAAELVGRSLSAGAMLSLPCLPRAVRAARLPDPPGLAQSCLTACLDPAG